MSKIQTQGVHHITFMGADRQTSNTKGMPSTPCQKSIEVWRSAPMKVMWCTP